MLINDLEYYKGKRNYKNKFCHIDHPNKSLRSTKDFLDYPIQDFDYQFNSWGFRGPEYEQYIGQSVNICLGSSFTVNLGGPIDHSWCSQLAKNLKIPTINLGMNGASNDAMKLVYSRACELFDVQDTFVMYADFYRCLNNNVFTLNVVPDEELFEYFLKQRIPNSYECGLPSINYNQKEIDILNEHNIYFLGDPYFSEYQTLYKSFIVKELYNSLRGKNWPNLKDFINGAEPHQDMFTDQFGGFICHSIYNNRDGHHMNYNANKKYADYLYQQWKQNNES
tara:strand:+ start:282 stop:1121 length:840 start_codon:yes stop_codon:yes gene_type:complete